MIEPLQAEFQLITRSFRTELAHVVRDIEKVGAALNALGAGSTGLEKSVASLEKTGAETKKAVSGLRETADGFKKVDKEARSALETVGHFLGRIALFSVGAGLVVRGFFAINQAIKDAVTAGVQFNQKLEQGRIAIAAILSSTRRLATDQGVAASAVGTYTGFLSKAADLQQELLIRSISTLGTYEELRDVFQLVLGFSGQQKATDEDRLQLAQNILNAGKLLGLSGANLAVEARQLLTLEGNRGQQILQSLGLTVQQLRVFQQQGTLVTELNKRLTAYSVIADDVALTWEGLTTSVQTFAEVITGKAFTPIFENLKEILKGIASEMRTISAIPLFTSDLSSDQLQALGRTFANLFAGFVSSLANATSVLLEFLASTKTLGSILAGLVGGAVDILTTSFQGWANVLGLVNQQIEETVQAAKTLGRSIQNIADAILPGAGRKLAEFAEALKNTFLQAATGGQLGRTDANVQQLADDLLELGNALRQIGENQPTTQAQLDKQLKSLQVFSEQLRDIGKEAIKLPEPDRSQITAIVDQFQTFINRLRYELEQ